MNEVLENILTRRSIRNFNDKTVNSEDLKLILKAGVNAPSGMNKQTWRFTVLKNAEKIEKLAQLIRKETGRDKSYNFYGAKTLILLSNDKDNTNGLADCACALENIFLMANSLNIGSCWINQLKTICDVKEVRELLTSFEIPQNHIVWGIAALGYSEDKKTQICKDESVIKIIE